MSGYGGILAGDLSTVTVPAGTKIRFYGPHNESIFDSLGNKIELSPRWPFTQRAAEVARPGDIVPDYLLYPPAGLKIVGSPVTVETPTRLSELVKNGRSSGWAPCRNVASPSP
ncbi:putative adhesin [Arthrobacter psychrochitiniphilus]|uniref:putative adhesin n=1 Tax=Arthrobacter psychrochitiniphilus TaxID=291045 RepID=UPI00358DBC5B